MRFRWILVLAISGNVLAQTAQPEHQHHPPRSADAYAKVLEDPKRDSWQHPHQVITALGIKPGDIIADIGSGSGYFTRRFVMHSAKVYAVDINAKLLEVVKKNAPANVETILAQPDDPKLPPASVDLVFFCNVLHHIENRPAYYQKLAQALKPGGRIVNIDFHKRELPVGPPVRMKLTEDEVIREFRAAGFTDVRRVETLPYQYFLIFTK
jgi:ubiquinone/menaquinone biosynthesis C-methylase UbiE